MESSAFCFQVVVTSFGDMQRIRKLRESAKISIEKVAYKAEIDAQNLR